MGNTAVPISEPNQITVDDFRVRALVRDPAFYAALAAVAVDLIPGAGAWIAEHRAALVPLGIVLAGHFLVRAASVTALGKATH